MAGNYTHTTRAAGTILTPTIYNSDHQNHVDNSTPTGLDDYSTNTTLMRTTTDPGEVGTESLATSLAGELERLRFIIKEITGATYWYETPKAVVVTSNGEVTKPLQPAFLSYGSSGQSNMAVGSDVKLAFNTELFDQNSDFDTTTNTFTAPVTGKYMFNLLATLVNVDFTGMTSISLKIVAGARTYQKNIYPAEATADSPVVVDLNIGPTDMTAGQTAIAYFNQSGGAAQAGFTSAGATTLTNFFSGMLIA